MDRLDQKVRITDLKAGEWLKVKCTVCGHRSYMSPPVLLNGLGFHPDDLLIEVRSELRCHECHTVGKFIVSVRGTVSA